MASANAKVWSGFQPGLPRFAVGSGHAPSSSPGAAPALELSSGLGAVDHMFGRSAPKPLPPAPAQGSTAQMPLSGAPSAVLMASGLHRDPRPRPDSPGAHSGAPPPRPAIPAPALGPDVVLSLNPVPPPLWS